MTDFTGLPITSDQLDTVIFLLSGLTILVCWFGVPIVIMLFKIRNLLADIASDTLSIAPHAAETTEIITQIGDAATDMVTLLDVQRDREQA